MTELWISLNDIPAEGREFDFTDQSLWTGPMQEYALALRIGSAFKARMLVIPQDDGFLVSGSFSGSVIQPCGRCAEEFELPVEGRFESFEEPGTPEEELAGENRLRLNSGQPELDAAGYLWEQFLLALPDKPLCAEACKGLCPRCGTNWNQGSCSCDQDKGDPRLAVLRNLKLS